MIFVFALTYLLLPLIWFKSSLPAALYASGLVLLHVVVLGVYCYKVHFMQLDPNWRSAAARLLGLAVCIGLLLLVSDWADSNIASLFVFALQLLVLCAVHTLILAFLMVRVAPNEVMDGQSQQSLLEHADAA